MATPARPGECVTCGSRLYRFTPARYAREGQRVIDLTRGEHIASCGGSTICRPMAHEASPIRLEALEPAPVRDIDLFDEIASPQDDARFMQVMFEVVRSRDLHTRRRAARTSPTPHAITAETGSRILSRRR